MSCCKKDMTKRNNICYNDTGFLEKAIHPLVVWFNRVDVAGVDTCGALLLVPKVAASERELTFWLFHPSVYSIPSGRK